jgi:membrane fusion protein (multidrug efflux system)
MGMGRGQPQPQAAEERPSPVLLAAVARGTIQGQIRAASTIEAELQVTVHAESAGRITMLDLEEGDDVTEGDVLARIRRDAQSLGVERAETNLADVEREFERVKKLYEQGIASQSEYDQTKTKLDAAYLDIKDRRIGLANTVIKAPFSGVLTRRFVDPGGFVANGAQIFEITDFKTLVARVYVPEKELDRIRVGQAADIVGKAAAGRRGTGEVARIAPIVDAATGTVKVTVGLPKALAGGERGFLPGMYAEVTLTTETRDEATLVPKQALVYDEDEAFVFVVEGDRVKRVRVELGLLDDDRAEVVKGVGVGAEIVDSGHAGLKDGALITRVDGTGQPVEAGAASASLVQNAAGHEGA